MRRLKIASTGAICAALHYAPLVSTLLVMLLIIAAVVFLCWFVRLPTLVRADVIRLIRALRGR